MPQTEQPGILKSKVMNR